MHAIIKNTNPTNVLLLIKLFVTISFSVTYSSLVLYMVNKLKLSDISATTIMSAFIAYLFILRVVTGYLGGRFLSYRCFLLLGLLYVGIGSLLISMPNTMIFYIGLSLLILGNGFLVAIHCILTQLYQHNNQEREAAFILNYSGMNIGYIIGFSLSGFFHLQQYTHLFLIGSLGAFVALILLLFHWKKLEDTSTLLAQTSTGKKYKSNVQGLLIINLMLGFLWLIINNAAIATQLTAVVSAGIALMIIYFAMTQPTAMARQNLWAYFVLALIALLFWTLYNLTPTLLTLFIERNVDRHILNILVPPQFIQNINALTIIFGGPLICVLTNQMRQRKVSIPIPFQFLLALLLISLSFLVLTLGINFANARGYMHLHWLIASYVLQSLGELMIAPIGFAMIGSLVPTQLQGALMGVWMMIIGIGAILSEYIATITLSVNVSTNPLLTNMKFALVFGLLGSVSFCLAIVLFFFKPYLLRLMRYA